MDVLRQYTTLVRDAMNMHHQFVASVDKALATVINDYQQSPNLLARYSDQLLGKGGIPDLQDDERQANLDTIVTLFKYIDNKDVFERYYQSYLSKRLLGKTCVATNLRSK